MKNKILKTLTGIAMGTLMFGMTAFAAEFTVTDTNAVLYTVAGADLLTDADLGSNVAIKDMQAGLPLQVTGITSNGFFRVSLDGSTYYVVGSELAQAVAVTLPANVNDTATIGRNADGTVPVKDANGNYVCVIEENDGLTTQAITDSLVSSFKSRKDYTQNPIYIYFRDEAERQIAAGNKNIKIVWNGISPDTEALRIAKNVILDIYKSHPKYQDDDFDLKYDIPKYVVGMKNTFNGQDPADYIIYLNYSDVPANQK